jgi:hypothetical protein
MTTPHNCNENDLGKLPTGLYLGMYHGRNTLDEDLSDWGFNGPMIPIENLTVTYFEHYRIQVRPDLVDTVSKMFSALPEDWIDLAIVNDLLQCDGKFYGDWSIFYHVNTTTMGLDMYAFSLPADSIPDDTQVDFAQPAGIRPTELFYWRKHHDLHGWMGQLYVAKGGASPDFNCDRVRLTLEDLADLEDAVKENALPATSGFFFGDNPPDADSIAKDMAFIEKAREALAQGLIVYYDSWW